jgi:hypothetical protein
MSQPVEGRRLMRPAQIIRFGRILVTLECSASWLFTGTALTVAIAFGAVAGPEARQVTIRPLRAAGHRQAGAA